jgi:hypothetical protein
MRRIALGLLIGLTIISLVACSGSERLSTYDRVMVFLEKLDSLIDQYVKPDEQETIRINPNLNYWYERTDFEVAQTSQHTMSEYPLHEVGIQLKNWADRIRDWDVCVDMNQYEGAIRVTNTAHVSPVDRCMVDFSLVIQSELGGGLVLRYRQGDGRIVMRQSEDSDGSLRFAIASFQADDRPARSGYYSYSAYHEGDEYQQMTSSEFRVNYQHYDLRSNDSVAMIIDDGLVISKTWYHAINDAFLIMNTDGSTVNETISFYNEDTTVLSISLHLPSSGESRITMDVDLMEVSGWDRVYLSSTPNDLVSPNALYLGDQLILEQRCLSINRGCYGVSWPWSSASLTLFISLNADELLDDDLNLHSFGLELQDERFTLDLLAAERDQFATIETTLSDYATLVLVSEGKRTYPGFVDRALFW